MSAIRQPSKTDDEPITAVFRLPIDHPTAWKPADFASQADYTIDLTASQLRDVEHAHHAHPGTNSGTQQNPK